jgi:hypothetical protein
MAMTHSLVVVETFKPIVAMILLAVGKVMTSSTDRMERTISMEITAMMPS